MADPRLEPGRLMTRAWTRALVRAVPDRYAEATVAEPARRGSIDLALAREQHAAYVAALHAARVEVEVLPPAHDLPDSLFVEDQAVVFRGRALLTRSGHPGRRAESPAVAAALAPHLELCVMDAPACLDGGDVLVVGDTLFAGLSGRSNPEGHAALRAAFEPLGGRVVPVPVTALHLKCVASSPAAGVVLVADGALDTAPFTAAGLDLVSVPAEEAYAANTLAVVGGVLLPAGYPRVALLLRERGLTPVPLGMSELHKGDGALTCLSVLY
jgi:dimethylargininase